MTKLSTAVRQAYKSSPQYALDQLMDERRKWQRRQTIAANKLAAIQAKLDYLAQENVNTLMGKEAK